MTDDPSALPTGKVDATGQPLDQSQVLAPQQVPMDDAAGGPDADTEETIDQVSTEELSVQGGA